MWRSTTGHRNYSLSCYPSLCLSLNFPKVLKTVVEVKMKTDMGHVIYLERVWDTIFISVSCVYVCVHVCTHVHVPTCTCMSFCLSCSVTLLLKAEKNNLKYNLHVFKDNFQFNSYIFLHRRSQWSWLFNLWSVDAATLFIQGCLGHTCLHLKVCQNRLTNIQN